MTKTIVGVPKLEPEFDPVQAVAVYKRPSAPREIKVKPGFHFTYEGYRLYYPGRILLMGLWSICDAQGVFESNPDRLAFLFRMDDLELQDYEITVKDLLRELETHRFIQLFEVDGVTYGCILDFGKPNDFFDLG